VIKDLSQPDTAPITTIPAKRKSTWIRTAVLGAVTAWLLVAASGVLFSVFMFYDDEGYVLTSYRAFVEHGMLYRDVYTQYGPFPYVLYQMLHGLGMPLTHTAGRIVTLSIWTGAALGCTMLVGQAVRNLALQLAVLVAAFVYLWVMASEPSHPGGLVVAFTVALASAGFHWITKGRIRAWALTVGAVTAVLILTKINIGIFVACSAFAWWSLHHTDVRIRRLAMWVLPIAAILLPMGLMRPLLDVPWVQNFAFIFATSAVAVLLTLSRFATPRVGWADAGWATLAGAGVAFATIAVVGVQGTGIHDLLDGILLGPMRHPVTFSLRYLWPPGIVAITLLSLTLAVVARVGHDKHRANIDVVIATLRLIAALALAWNISRFPLVSPDYLTFGWTMPFVWVFLWPLQPGNASQLAARAWIGLLLLGQCLHVFPVPGSQIAWGTLLTIPLAATGGWEAASWLAARFRPTLKAKQRWPWAAPRVAHLALFMFVVVAGWKFTRIGARYHSDADLRLPGAESLRLPGPFAATLRIMVVNAAAHADVLFSFPGMFSFNLWSGVPSPTLNNVTHWFSLLNDEQQRGIIRALEAQPRACVIVHREHIQFLTSRNLTPRGPLCDYIEQHFDVAFTLDHYEFRVRRGRRLVPFMLGEILARAESARIAPKSDAITDTLLQIPVLLPSKSPITQVDIVSGEQMESLVFRLAAANARVEVTPLTIRGEPTGPSEHRVWPFAIEGPALLSLYYDRGDKPAPPRDAVLVFRDIEGNTITTARFKRCVWPARAKWSGIRRGKFKV
jgi:hypothetical protein